MHCGNCAKRVTAALSELADARDAAVDLEGACAKVSTSDTEETIKAAVEGLGFEVVSIAAL